MLQRWNSRTPLAGALREHECPRCHREVDLPLGALCPVCEGEINGRARKVGRLVAAASTIAVALYIFLPPPPDERARLVGMVGLVVWYILSNLVTRRVMAQWNR